jgi:hypothetical protein
VFLNAFCIAHTLNPHAVIEPFVIATNRELSVLHPIHKLLHPHFRDTMNINACAWQNLINGGEILEVTVPHCLYNCSYLAIKIFILNARARQNLINGGEILEVTVPHCLYNCSYLAIKIFI